MNSTCSLVLKQCLPCNDDPIRNISAEAPDVNVFIGFRDFKWNPPLGVTYFQLACKTLCFSTVSQEEADLCAQQNAQSCVWKGGKLPVTPPQPPGPGNTGGKGNTSNTPGGIPGGNPATPIASFKNVLRTCDALCPDGTTYTEQVIAGTVIELSQALADAKAKSLACIRAQQNLFCISAAIPPSACVGETYFFRLTTSGGLDLIWSIDGVLPPGLNLNSLEGTITGTPLSAGAFTFTVEVTDSRGRGQTKVLTICIMQIVTATTLPAAPIGQVYAVPLIQQPATVSSEVWTLVSGSLPPGITLASNGALTGTPTVVGISGFTVKVDATCAGSTVSCQKAFSLAVASVVNCFGSPNSIGGAVWTQISPPGSGTITVIGGDGTFSVPAIGGFVEAVTSICNPNTAPYAFTVNVDWTMGNIGTELAAVTVVLNGVFSYGPAHSGPGTFNFNFAGLLLSGTNTLDIQWVGNGALLSGTCTIRPLTPP